MEHMMAIVMAAGHGKRMKSNRPKVLHTVCGKPMIDRVVAAAQDATGNKPVVVVGVGREAIMEHLGDRADFAVQAEQKGTGHAVMMAEPYLSGKSGYAVVLAGDMPLLMADTLRQLYAMCKEERLDAVVLTSEPDDPTGYGRVIRDTTGSILRIVEEKDASQEEKAIREVNSSVYCFRIESLLRCLGQLSCDNAQGEYYLTDCIAMLAATGRVGGLLVDAQQCSGVNDKAQLAAAEAIMRRRINHGYLVGGVIMMDPDHTYIEDGAVIGQDTILYPGCHIRGKSAIGADCVIESGTVIDGSTVGDRCHIRDSVIMDSTVGNDVTIGPFAYLRPATVVEDGVHIGDFVEIKKARIGEGTKLPHLTYVGDADVGAHCNIACGTIFANYDGLKKYQTTVGDGVFIGCNVNLVAPCTVGDGAYVAAGTTVVGEVPAGALSVGRSQQYIKEDWADEKRKKGALREVY